MQEARLGAIVGGVRGVQNTVLGLGALTAKDGGRRIGARCKVQALLKNFVYQTHLTCG